VLRESGYFVNATTHQKKADRLLGKETTISSLASARLGQLCLELGDAFLLFLHELVKPLNRR
jgi:hypothetical protein